MKSRPASSASRASARHSGQLADQRSGTFVAERPDEQLAPNSPIFSALPLYMARRSFIDALGASTAFLPFRHHCRDGAGVQAERWAKRILTVKIGRLCYSDVMTREQVKAILDRVLT